jgi:hypothetical protein
MSSDSPLHALRQFIGGMQEVLVGLATTGHIEVYTLVATETCAIAALAQAEAQSIPEAEALSMVAPLL